MMQPDVIIAAMLSKVHTDTIFEHADVAESPWMAGMTTCAAAQTAPMSIPIFRKRRKPTKIG